VIATAPQTWATHRLRGDLNLTTVPGVFAGVREALARGGGLVVDLADVERTDSAGLALLVACVREAGARGASIRLRNLPDDMLKIARVTGLDTVLAPFQTES